MNIKNEICDNDEIVRIVKKAKGDISWREFSRRVGVNHSLIYRIKRHEYTPGLKTLNRFCLIKPLEERNEMYQELLLAAGFGQFRSL